MKRFACLILLGAAFSLSTPLLAETPEVKENQQESISSFENLSQVDVFEFKVSNFTELDAVELIQNDMEAQSSISFIQNYSTGSVLEIPMQSNQSPLFRKARDGFSCNNHLHIKKN